MRDLIARNNDHVYGIEELDLFHPHALAKKGWLEFMRRGRKEIPDLESVALQNDLWVHDILAIDSVYQWLTNDDPTYKAGEDLLAKRLQQERAAQAAQGET